MRLIKPKFVMLLLLSASILAARPFAIHDSTDSRGWGEKIWYYTEYENDVEGKLLFSTAYSRDSESGEFVPRVKRRYRYSKIPVYTEEILSTWSPENAKWTDLYKYENTYNERGDLILYEEANWTPDYWVPSRKKVSDFDENGNQLLRATYSWNSSDQIWVSDNYEAYTFNEQSQQTSHISYAWDASIKDVTPRTRHEQVFDEIGLLILAQSFDWDDALDDWRFESKTEYFYDELGLMEHAKGRFVWSATDSTWNPFSNKEYGYDEYDNLVLEIQSEPDFNPPYEMAFKRKKVYAYDESGKQTFFEIYKWDVNRDDWKGSTKYLWTFDEASRQLTFEEYVWDEEDWTWKGTRKTFSSFDSGGLLVLDESVIWEYLSSTGIRHEMKYSGDMLVFPNPAPEALQLEFDSELLVPGVRIIIYSFLGIQQVEYKPESSQAEIDISMLEPGSYLLVLGSGSKRLSRIFVKQ